MNEIVKRFLLAGDKFMPEMHLRHRQEIQAIFTKMNLIRLVFSMTWHMEILKI